MRATGAPSPLSSARPQPEHIKARKPRASAGFSRSPGLDSNHCAASECRPRCSSSRRGAGFSTASTDGVRGYALMIEIRRSGSQSECRGRGGATRNSAAHRRRSTRYPSATELPTSRTLQGLQRFCDRAFARRAHRPRSMARWPSHPHGKRDPCHDRLSVYRLDAGTRRFAGTFEADEGTRTLDLLHGKQTL